MRTKVFILALIGSLFLSCESVEETIDPCITDNCFYVKSVVTMSHEPAPYDRVYAVKSCDFSTKMIISKVGEYEEGKKYCE